MEQNLPPNIDTNNLIKQIDGTSKTAAGNPSSKNMGNYLGNSAYQQNPYQQGMYNQYGVQGQGNYPYGGSGVGQQYSNLGQYGNQIPYGSQGQYGNQGQYGLGYQSQYYNQPNQYGYGQYGSQYGTQYGSNYRPISGQGYPSSGINSAGYNSAGYPYWNDGKRNQLDIVVSFITSLTLLIFYTKVE
ncbi:unnamed protein product [Didymodactylos carnosus]|uniref:Uncharacterized protein n=1 Tax=Didymodactylos carnosus TaxID=1234261 RepID=A0A814PLT2_9BILA|nr:unnamed protein product [Didymodactylos carnosus]CAF1403857.1 unnamed protein product [Didymodactylos carnosus]CAF3872333.1 unnamed protein product [Didymodactylos carnosus]CAF4210128.1 unnamed protein product [Didymodactylos carnosus]